MLKVEAIVRVGSLKKIMTKLLEIDYPGLTVYEVQGHGRQRGVSEHYRDQTTLSLIPKLKLECVVSGPAEAKKAIAAIIAATRTGEQGDGKIFVTPVLEALRIRTGEEGTYAINEKSQVKAKSPKKKSAPSRSK
ncbi:MAG TPA: P-II family nitrogen regulator [bacterium]|jgi:nitrogen regulatory protein P-II 1|nr:P-II family nitrogen regulator [bacterium]HXC65058.1 P-II family nitrogen regulator [bacterium]